MADPNKVVSAFSVHSKKRKTLDDTTKSQKIKKGHTSLGDLTSNRQLRMQQEMKQLFKNDITTGKIKQKLDKGTHSPNKKTLRNKSKSLAPKKDSRRKSSRINASTLNNKAEVSSLIKKSPSKLGKAVTVSPTLSPEQLKRTKKERKRAKKERKRELNAKKSKKVTPKIKKQLKQEGSVSKTGEKTVKIDPNTDSVEDGKRLFQWLISPVDINQFFKVNWERAPLHIKRSKSNYYKQIMSTPLLDGIMRNFCVQFTKNIDITSYSDGIRETHNPLGRALPCVVWDYYMNGCSVRMLNPQTFIPKLHTLNATLQEYFGCFVGANSYLTPPNSQGFAPHYDDIEAFILQIEGKKRWRLYKPRNEEEVLPRFSSKNFDQSEIGVPILDTVVSAGDLLYFPRGTIHQGETIDNEHSLHITLSVYQRNSWGDFLEKLLPDALQQAINTDVEFREGLPREYLRNVGVVHSQDQSVAKAAFLRKTKLLLTKLIQHIDIDKAADEMAKSHIHDFLPPVLTEQEICCSAYEDGERMLDEGEVRNRVKMELDTKIRLLRAHCARLVEEDNVFRIYYSTENSKEYHEFVPQFLELDRELAPAMEEIILRYPEYVRVQDLPIDNEDNKIQVARDLWEKGIVVTDTPLPIME